MSSDHRRPEKLENLIEQIDWNDTSEDEKMSFAKSFTILELALLARIKAETARSTRFISLIASALIILCLSLLGVEPATIVIVAAAAQLALFAFSQFMEMIARNLVAATEKSTIELLQGLVRRHPNSRDN